MSYIFEVEFVLPVEKCTLTDSACMLPAFQKMLPTFVAGMPEHNVDILDPLAMPDVKFDLSGLQFSLDGGSLKGLKNAVFDSVKWDTEKHKFSFSFSVDAVLKGHYMASGRILILPITGDGQMKLKLKNMFVKINVDYDMAKDGETEYIKLKKHTVEFDVRDNAHFTLTNLFNGNKDLSDAMLKFMNENWKQISLEFGRPLVDVAAGVIYQNMQNFFSKMDLKDIAN